MNKLTQTEFGLALILGGVVIYGIYKAQQAAALGLSDAATAVANAPEAVRQVYNSQIRTPISDTMYDYFGPAYDDPNMNTPGYNGVGQSKKGATSSQAMAVFNMMGVASQPRGDLDFGTDFNSYPDNFVQASKRMAKPSLGRTSQPSSPYASN